jgi:hypothetical protein
MAGDSFAWLRAIGRRDRVGQVNGDGMHNALDKLWERFHNLAITHMRVRWNRRSGGEVRNSCPGANRISR